MDKGYTDAETLVDSAHDYGVTIVGPVADDPSWQARTEGGLDKSQFTVDWERQEVTCPAGKRSASWVPNTHPKNGVVIEALFARKDCLPCPLRPLCTRAKVGSRAVGVRVPRGASGRPPDPGVGSIPGELCGAGRHRRYP